VRISPVESQDAFYKLKVTVLNPMLLELRLMVSLVLLRLMPIMLYIYSRPLIEN